MKMRIDTVRIAFVVYHDNYGGDRRSTGIIGWLEVIESDLSTTLAETTATEKSAVVMRRQAPKMQRCTKLGHPHGPFNDR